MRSKFIILLMLWTFSPAISQNKTMENYVLKPLSYSINALEPIMSAQTLELHWGKHLATYVNNYNNLKKETQFATTPLLDAIMRSNGALFNNAAQIYNHEFFFNELSPMPQRMPEGNLLKDIETYFGSFDKFKEDFTKAAMGQFGSGWAWLCVDKEGKLVITATSNAENPMRAGLKPIMNIDVWEHAYYVDYQNRRADFVKEFWNLINWKIVQDRLNQ